MKRTLMVFLAIISIFGGFALGTAGAVSADKPIGTEHPSCAGVAKEISGSGSYTVTAEYDGWTFWAKAGPVHELVGVLHTGDVIASPYPVSTNKHDISHIDACPPPDDDPEWTPPTYPPFDPQPCTEYRLEKSVSTFDGDTGVWSDWADYDGAGPLDWGQVPDPLTGHHGGDHEEDGDRHFAYVVIDSRAITTGDCAVNPCAANYFEAEGMWEITWGRQFSDTDGEATFNMQSHGGLTSLNGGPVPAYMTPDWRWLYVTHANVENGRTVTYGFADGTVRTAVVSGDAEGCPSVVWSLTPPPPVDICTTDFDGSGSVANWIASNGRTNGGECFAISVTPECGVVNGSVTEQPQPQYAAGPFRLVWREGTETATGYKNFPATFDEDYNGGSVDITYFIVGPEKDWLQGATNVPNYWTGNGVTITVDTDCQPNETFPDLTLTCTTVTNNGDDGFVRFIEDGDPVAIAAGATISIPEGAEFVQEIGSNGSFGDTLELVTEGCEVPEGWYTSECANGEWTLTNNHESETIVVVFNNYPSLNVLPGASQVLPTDDGDVSLYLGATPAEATISPLDCNTDTTQPPETTDPPVTTAPPTTEAPTTTVSPSTSEAPTTTPRPTSPPPPAPGPDPQPPQPVPAGDLPATGTTSLALVGVAGASTLAGLGIWILGRRRLS